MSEHSMKDNAGPASLTRRRNSDERSPICPSVIQRNDFYGLSEEDPARCQLVDALEKAPFDPSAWLKLLQNKPKKSFPAAGMLRLYRRFAVLMSKQLERGSQKGLADSQDLASVYINFVDFQKKMQPGSVQETLKFMETYGIGKKVARFYTIKATLNLDQRRRNFPAALAVLQQGLDAGARPRDLLEEAKAMVMQQMAKESGHSGATRPRVSSQGYDVDDEATVQLSPTAGAAGRRTSGDTGVITFNKSSERDPDATVKLDPSKTAEVVDGTDEEKEVIFNTRDSKALEEQRSSKHSTGSGRSSDNGEIVVSDPKFKTQEDPSSSRTSSKSAAKKNNTLERSGSMNKSCSRLLTLAGPAKRISAGSTSVEEEDADYGVDDFLDVSKIKKWMPPPRLNSSISEDSTNRSNSSSLQTAPTQNEEGMEREKETSLSAKEYGGAVGTANLSTFDVASKKDKEPKSSRPKRGRQKASDSSGEEEESGTETKNPYVKMVSQKNIIRVKNIPYLKLGMIGRGGSSKVYRCLNPDGSFVALKRVRTEGMEQKAINSYANEIALLNKLAGEPRIIELYSAEVDSDKSVIHMVLEAGDIDLAKLLSDTQKNQAGEGYSGLGPHRAREMWKQMLEAVSCIHKHRIVHGDLKPANFLLVKGNLKLIDFGIARAINDDTTNVYRENQVGTLNYMSPESILHDSSANAAHGKAKPIMKVGRASDVWSLGCIQYQIAYGRTPFADLHLIPKLQAIINKNHKIEFPPLEDVALVEMLENCLQRNPKKRPEISGKDGLLSHDYLKPQSRKVQSTQGSRISIGMLQYILEKSAQLKDKYTDTRELAQVINDELYCQRKAEPSPASVVSQPERKKPLADSTNLPKGGLPESLKSQITKGKENLKSLHKSDSDKYMIKSAANSNGLRSQFEEAMSRMKDVMHDSTEETMDTSMTWTLT